MLLFPLLGCAGTKIPLGDTGAGDDTAPGDDTAAPAATPWGTGADGPLVAAELVDLSTDASGDRRSPDGVAYAVTTIDGTEVTLAGSPEGLATGDEVLLVDVHGSDAAHADVGRYAFARLVSVTSHLTLDSTVDLGDLTDQAVQLVRVPNYTDVTVAGTLTTSPWNGVTGGVLAFRANGVVTVTGRITVAALGYAGGASGVASDDDAYQGESYAGEGTGGHDSTEGYNQATGEWAAHYGGGGAQITGGGGNYAGGATGGESWDGYATAPQPGETYGAADLTEVFFGSGGGGVWHGNDSYGPGGAGGGIVFVAAATIDASAGAFDATGETATSWSRGSWTYGAGGGAGGTVWVQAGVATFAPGAIDARGGWGEATHDRVGGDGGEGRVRVDCETAGGVPCDAGALAGVASPEVGWVGELPGD